MSLLGFLFWIVVARLYTEAEVGFSTAIISIINLLALLSLLGLNFTLIRCLPQSEKPQQLINTCFTLSGIISLVVAGIFLAGLDFWSPALSFVKENMIFSSAFVIFTLLWSVSTVVDAAFVATRKAEFVLSKNTTFSLIKIPLPILFILFFHTFDVVASWGVALGAALAVSLFLFLPKAQSSYRLIPALKLSLIRGMWQYSGGNYLANLLSAAPGLILPLIVVNLIGAEQNAYFYIAWMVAGLLFAIPSGGATSLFVEGSHFENEFRQNVAKSVKFTFLLLVPATIVVILAGKWLLLAFGQSYSANALHLLQILAFSSLPLGINRIYTSILRVTDRVKELIAIWGLIAIGTLLASYLIMPDTGIIGIGYAWLGAQVAVAIYILSARRLTATI